MAGKFLLLTPAFSDQSGATLSASSSATGYPVSNLKLALPHLQWRSTSRSAWIRLVLPSAIVTPQNWKFYVWAGYLNAFSASETVRVRASSDTSPDTTPDYDSGLMSVVPSGAIEPVLSMFPRGLPFFHSFTLGVVQVFQSVQLDFSWSVSNPDAFVRSARFMLAVDQPEGNSFTGNTLASTWRPSRSWAYGSGAPTEDPVEDGVRAEGGPLYAFEREAPVRSEKQFRGLRFFDYQMFRWLVRQQGAWGDVVAIDDHETTGEIIENTTHGYLRGVDTARRRTRTAAGDIYDLSFDVESIL